MAKVKFKAATPPFKRSAEKRNTSTRRQAATSPVFALLRRGKQVQWSDSVMKRLHPPSLCELWRDKQARLLGNLVKMSRLHCITPWQGRKPMVLSEERLSPREEKTYVFVRHFFCCSKMLLWDCLHFIQAIPHFCKKMADPSSPIRATP